MDNFFHIIEGARVIVVNKGVFTQRKVYRRGNRLYAGHGVGFIRLGAQDSTSCPNHSWSDLDLSESDIKLGKGPTFEPIIL